MRALTLAILFLPFLAAPALAQPAGLTGALDPNATRGSRFEGLAGVGSGSLSAPGAALTLAVQQALIDMGFAPPNARTGNMGALTQRGLKNFQVHAARTFSDVRATGQLDPATLRALTTLAPPAGQRGQRGRTPSNVYDGRKVRVVVVKSEHRTFVYDDAGNVAHIFVNATGARATPTRSALKTIDGKIGKADADALGRRLWGSAGVFGDRIVGLSGGGQELHGTSAPLQLGLDVSHGCVRHHNPDIVTLFGVVKVGDLVAIVDRIDDAHLGAPAPLAAAP